MKRGTILGSVVSNWFGLLIAGLVSIALTPFLIHQLGAFQYGLWIMIASLTEYYGLLDLGMRITVQRFVAACSSKPDHRDLDEFFATAILLTLTAAALIAVVGSGLAFWLPRIFAVPSESVPIFRWLALLLSLSVAVTLVARLLGTYLCGLQRFDLYNLIGVGTVLARAALLVLAIKLGYGLVGMAAGTLLVALLSVPLYWVLMRRTDPFLEVSLRLARWAKAKEIIRFSSMLFLNMVGNHLRTYSDPLVIGKFLTIALITPFAIATRLMEYFKLLLQAVAGPLLPAMSRLDGQQRETELQHLFVRSAKVSSLLTFFVASILLLNGSTLIRFWVGPQFSESYHYMLILLAGYIFAHSQLPAHMLLIARGRPGVVGGWALAEGGANLLISIAGALKFGLIGVAAGTTIPLLIVKGFIEPGYALRMSGLSVASYLKSSLLRPSLATALFLLASPLLVTHSEAPSMLAFVASLVYQTLIYGACAWFIGLASVERESVWARAKLHFQSLRSQRASTTAVEEAAAQK